MTYAVTPSFGAVIKIGDGGGSEVFTAINGVHNGPNGPSPSVRMIEASHHGSSSLIKKPSFWQGGTVTFDIYYDSTDTQHLLLMTSNRAKTRKNFQMVLTDSGTEQYAFAAYISSMAFKGDVEGFNVYSVTLDIDGDITIS